MAVPFYFSGLFMPKADTDRWLDENEFSLQGLPGYKLIMEFLVYKHLSDTSSILKCKHNVFVCLCAREI